MPFTLSHPAIILPFHKKLGKYFNMTGLIIGSLSPDFGMFIGNRAMSHNFIGGLLFNITASMFLAYGFHCLIKRPTISHLPHPIDKWMYNIYLSKRVLEDTLFHNIVLIYSIVIGVATHIYIDSFTHSTNMTNNILPILESDIIIIGIGIPIYFLLQLLTSLIGLIVIPYYLFKYRNRNFKGFNKITAIDKIKFWTLVIGINTLITVIDPYRYGLIMMIIIQGRNILTSLMIVSYMLRNKTYN